MKKKRRIALLIAFVLTTLFLFCACASFGGLSNSTSDGTGISARGAIGRVEVDNGARYEGNGGLGLRLAVLAPQTQANTPEYAWLPVYIQGLLNNNFKKYSAITIIDRQNLDKILAEQSLSASGHYSMEDYVSIGRLTNAQYIVIGTLQKLPGAGQFALQLAVTNLENGERKASFMKNGNLAALQSGMLINEASADILSQLGITLTAYGERSLLSGSSVAAKAEAGLARGIMAQASGASVEALFNYTQAINFDPSQIEALARLNVLSSSISGGSLSERIVNDLQARDRWLEAFKEAFRFFNEHPPFEITFDPNLIQEGETDYAKRTATLGMRVALDPSEAGFAALNALLEGLEQTGRRAAWGFRGWPLQDISPKTPGTVLFAGKQSLNFKLDVTLLNEKGKTIGKSSVTLTSGRLGFAAGGKEVPAPNGAAGMMRFANVKADDLTPTLTIVISAVNGIPSVTLNANGYMRIDAGDLDKKNAAVFNNSALAYFNKGDWDRAIADYNRAIQLDPSNTVYKDNLQAAVNAVQKAAADYNTNGLANYKKKEYDRAIADYNQAIRLDPSNTAYRNNLAAAQKAREDQIAAAGKAEAASYNTSGFEYFNKKEYIRAIADYENAIRLDPSNTAYKKNLQVAQKAGAAACRNSGWTFANAKIWDRAISEYSLAISLDPDNAWAYNARGNAYFAKRDYYRAIADYRQAILRDSSEASYQRNLEMALRQ